MRRVRFEWDRAKARANQKKHGLGFLEVRELFTSGVDYVELYDDMSSTLEERFIAVGPIRRGVVVVVWTERSDDAVRIVSARFATKRELRLYRHHLGGAT